ncbi:MAG: ferredoxin [Flavobacterium sp.]|nr:ferredoxin [Flavobacterium sp.]
MKRYEKHLFVCENRRPEGHPKGCCADKNSDEITKLFKKRLAELSLNKDLRVNSSGCLGACEFGPSIVVYPEQIWYGNVKAADVEEIIQSHLLNNIPVERLIIKDKNYH